MALEIFHPISDFISKLLSWKRSFILQSPGNQSIPSVNETHEI